MQTYNSNIVGSNLYFYSKRRALDTLMNQEDSCTICYTLSTAENHWVDIHRMLYGKRPLPNISYLIKNVRWKRNTKCRFLHIVDTFFYKRVKNLFATIFADAELLCEWWWKRRKYQKRGTVHIQGFLSDL